MLVAVCSVKGAPGVTAAALALAAAWPRPAVLVEADPSGGDLAYRCRAATGQVAAAVPNLLTLAAAVRGGSPDAGVVARHAQRLGCGVDLVPGVTAPAQARGLGGLWPAVARACRDSGEFDVLVDLGRLDRTSAVLPVAEAADTVLTVTSSSLEAVMHLREGLRELVGVLNTYRVASVVPVIVGADTHAGRDCADLDQFLTQGGLPVQPSAHLPYDPKALERLHGGEAASGRLGRALLLRGARSLATQVLETSGEMVTG